MKQILLLKIERFLMKEEFKNARLYLYLMVDVVVDVVAICVLEQTLKISNERKNAIRRGG